MNCDYLVFDNYKLCTDSKKERIKQGEIKNEIVVNIRHHITYIQRGDINIGTVLPFGFRFCQTKHRDNACEYSIDSKNERIKQGEIIE